MIRKLAKEFITPIEREDIMALADAIDNVTDAIEDVVMRMYMYNITSIRPQAVKMTEIIVKCCNSLKTALVSLSISESRRICISLLLKSTSWKKRETDSLRKRQEICIAIAMTSERSRHGILLSTILKSAVMRAKMLQMP